MSGPTAQELAATAVYALSMDAITFKQRLHGVVDEAEDLNLPYWAGVIPLRVVQGAYEPAPGLAGELIERERPADCWPKS